MIPRQLMRLAAILAVVMTPTAGWAGPEQSVSQTPAAAPPVAQAEITGCAQAHPIAERTIDIANRRLEAARQTNSPAAMRSAIEDMQAALRQLRADIAPCAGLQSLAAAGPHAGHVIPSAATPPAAPAPPAVRPESPAPARATVAPAAPTAAATQPRSATQGQAGQGNGAAGPMITFRSVPSPLQSAAESEFEVTVTDRQGKELDGAEVSLLFYMPGMPSMRLPEMRIDVKLKGAGKGRYTGTGQVMMAGRWTVTVRVKQNGEEVGQQKLAITAK